MNRQNTQNTQNVQNTQNNIDMSANRTSIERNYIRDQNQMIIQTIVSLTTAYNENINYYNSNIRHMIDILENHHNHVGNLYNEYSARQQEHVRNRQYYSNNSNNSNYSTFIDNTPFLQTPFLQRQNGQNRQRRTQNIRNIFQNVMEDVIVRPTSTQLNNALEDISYNGTTGAICPITLEPFETGESVCKIIHCGHMFKRTALYDWFSRNVRCPICRYDIREYVSTDSSASASASARDSLLNEIVDQIFLEQNQESQESINNYLSSLFSTICRVLGITSINRIVFIFNNNDV
jgi:hypothetical protein